MIVPPTSFLDRLTAKIPKWIQILGMILLILGLYYWDITYNQHTPQSTTPPDPITSTASLSPTPGAYPDRAEGSGSETLKDRIQKQILTILQDTEVQATLLRIEKDRPLYHQDGAVFQNREKKLPRKTDRSYYSEWTVKTPGSYDRGARRIIEGKGGEMYFTDDHYQSFVRVR